jgi:LuxR family maltose regulon positive regulatory protein
MKDESCPDSLHPSHVAWVALDAGDNDPVRFWRYVIHASQAFATGVGATARELLHASPRPAYEVALTTLINDLARLPERCVLVLEDYHAIAMRQIHEQVAFLLDHLPPALRLVIITRSDPPLPLARMRARHELCELRPADLRFSSAETQDFLEQELPFPLPSGAVARLEARTEGWVAGLRLLALALRDQQSPETIEQVVTAISGSHQHIMEYLVGDVLAMQPAALQVFLLQTSMLSHLSASLCDAVTGRNDGAAVLAQLERNNLFVSPLDTERQWYRYHGLFAEAMVREARRRFDDEALRALSLRASRWYEAHGSLSEAVETALAARSFDRVGTLIERVTGFDPISPSRHYYQELNTSRRWLEQLPEETLALHPALCLLHAQSILFTSDRRAPATRRQVERPLRLAERAWQAADDRPNLGALLGFRSLVAMWQGDRAESTVMARQALDLLPAHETHWRGVSQLQAGWEDLFAGRLNAARRSFLEARACCAASGNPFALLAATTVLGDICAAQGEPRQAAAIYEETLAATEQDTLKELLSKRGHALAGLAELAYEWNDLPAAERQAEQAIAIGRQLDAEDLVVRGALVAARALQARGATAQARQRLHALLAQTKHLQRAREVRAHAARFALLVGDLAAAQRWYVTLAQPDRDMSRANQEWEGLVIARLRLARDEATEALRALDAWRGEAHAEGRVRSEIEILMLSALAQRARGDLARARQLVLAALELAQFEGYQRVFLDEGAALAGLLRAVTPAIRVETLRAYADTLLRASDKAWPEQAAAGAPVSDPPVESLTAQEQRVLELLVAGSSNSEIARALVVSINTIKTQVQSIYRKLNVTNRLQATNTARSLNLV